MVGLNAHPIERQPHSQLSDSGDAIRSRCRPNRIQCRHYAPCRGSSAASRSGNERLPGRRSHRGKACGNDRGSTRQTRLAVAVSACFDCSVTSAFTNAATHVCLKPCCMWQRNKAFDMAGGVMMRTGRMAGCGTAAQSAREHSANTADMKNFRIGSHSRTSQTKGLI
jgi:hypothetical protein